MSRASSSAALLRLGALAEFANHAFGIGVVDAHVLADLRLPIKQIFGMSDCRLGGLALDDVMLGLANDGARCRRRSRSQRAQGARSRPRTFAVTARAAVNDALSSLRALELAVSGTTVWASAGDMMIGGRLLRVYSDRAGTGFAPRSLAGLLRCPGRGGILVDVLLPVRLEGAGCRSDLVSCAQTRARPSMPWPPGSAAVQSRRARLRAPGRGEIGR